MAAQSVWDRFSLDPRQAEHARLRASDRDRDVVSEVLATAYAEGRLTPEELDERSDRVARSRTLGELPPIIDDLVVPTSALSPRGSHREEAERRYRQQRQNALFGFLTPTIICWVIWVALGADHFPWPAIVMVASGAKLLQVALTREDTTRSIERHLEKKERQRLQAWQEEQRRHLE
jgi:hypothetical protein